MGAATTGAGYPPPTAVVQPLGAGAAAVQAEQPVLAQPD